MNFIDHDAICFLFSETLRLEKTYHFQSTLINMKAIKRKVSHWKKEIQDLKVFKKTFSQTIQTLNRNVEAGYNSISDDSLYNIRILSKLMLLKRKEQNRALEIASFIYHKLASIYGLAYSEYDSDYINTLTLAVEHVAIINSQVAIKLANLHGFNYGMLLAKAAIVQMKINIVKGKEIWKKILSEIERQKNTVSEIYAVYQVISLS